MPYGDQLQEPRCCLQLSTSMSALSDSTTTTDSPFVILSPSLFNQDIIFPSVMVDESAGMKISLTALQVSIRWFRRAMSGFCVQTVECLPASAGLLHGVVVCMAPYMSALALDQRNAKAVLSRPTVTLAQYVRRTSKRRLLTTYIYICIYMPILISPIQTSPPTAEYVN